MEYQRIFELILDLGAAMIGCGGETRRVNTAVHMLAESYGFTNCNFWVVPSAVQGTVTAPAGEVYTEIRQIHGSSTDFGLLDALNTLSRKAVREKPDAAEFADALEQVRAKKKLKVWVTYLAGILGVAGFAGFFGCDFMDIMVTAAASLLGTFTMRHLSGRESNPLIKNLIISMMTEFFILTCVHFGFGHHVGLITTSVAMMLISGLATTNGIHDLVHLAPLSGITNITLSATGALGIAMGIAVPLFVLKSWNVAGQTPTDVSVPIMIVSAFAACIGFALWFGIRGHRLLIAALGSVITVGVFLWVSSRFTDSAFLTNLIASAVCGIYAQIMARVDKAPATIFITIGVLPLLPGSSLYYSMLGLVTNDTALSAARGSTLVRTAFGIVMGLMLVESAVGFVLGAIDYFNKKKKKAKPQKH